MKPSYNIRLFIDEDKEAVLKIRNDPAAVKASTNQNKIGGTEHNEWWDRTVKAGKYTRLYIIHQEKTVVGYGRIDFAENEGHISIAIASHFQHMGLGHMLLDRLINEAKGMQLKDIYASIRPENCRSIDLFIGANFEPLQKTVVWRLK